MANTIKSRVLLKTDITANWEKATNFIPKVGEVCIYSDRFQLDDGTYVPGIKVGDGTSYISELEFMGDEYITSEDIDEILQVSGEIGPSLTNETVTLFMPSISSGISQGTIVYVGSLNNEGLPIYKSEVLTLNYSKTFNIIKNSCFYLSNAQVIEDTYGYSGNDLKRLTDIAPGTTYQILNNVRLEFEEGAPV